MELSKLSAAWLLDRSHETLCFVRLLGFALVTYPNQPGACRGKMKDAHSSFPFISD